MLAKARVATITLAALTVVMTALLFAPYTWSQTVTGPGANSCGMPPTAGPCAATGPTAPAHTLP